MQGLLALQPAATCPIKLNALGHYQGRGGGVFKSSPIPTVHNPSCKTAAKHTKLERLLQGRIVSSCWLTTVVKLSLAPSPKHTTHFFNDLDECTMQGLLALQPAATCPIKPTERCNHPGQPSTIKIAQRQVESCHAKAQPK